jgi:hypothetical protein
MERAQFINEYGKCLEQGTGALFIGAGLSKQAGYPDWRTLLKDIATELQINLDQEHDLAGVAQWFINKSGKTRTRIGQLIKESFPDKPDPPASHRILARLPVRHVWTTNYDRLVERAWELQRRQLEVKAIRADLNISDSWADTTLYKMHGTVAHPTEIVIATDDYELYRRKRGGFLQVLNGHLIGLHFLFLGFSFTDPNIGHLLGLIRETMEDTPTQHYAIVRKPKKGTSADAERLFEYDKSRHAHWIHDLQRYGINCIEVNEYEDVTSMLAELEASVARRSIFVSGSYPDGLRDEGRTAVESVASFVGEIIGRMDLRLVSGFGSTVGSAVVAGVLGQLYANGIPALDRKLFLRPFPQVIPTGFNRASFQRRYREDLIQQAGICVFVGGFKRSEGSLEPAPGVLQEFEIAKAQGKVLIPVAATGGSAAAIWSQIKNSGAGSLAKLPDAIFERLGATSASLEEMKATIMDAISSAREARIGQ